jgi:delta1-piperideine-2-carboxylate reductase
MREGQHRVLPSSRRFRRAIFANATSLAYSAGAPDGNQAERCAMNDDQVECGVADLTAKVEAALAHNGFAADCAALLAATLVRAQADGRAAHGVFRVSSYVASARCGYLNGAPEPRLEDAAPGFLRVDADNGPAQVALAAAEDAAIDKARRCGAAVVAIRNSHHVTALYLDVERFAAAGLIALAVINASAVVAPAPGAAPVFGTNPLAFAAPRADGLPLVFDQASSALSQGEIQIAARAGRAVPEGTGYDSEGAPTTDAAAILDGGALAAFGGYKGANMALMIELLCAGLGGGAFSYETPHERPPEARTSRTGMTLLLIDPERGIDGHAGFARRVDALLAELERAGQTHLPGRRRERARHAGGDAPVRVSRADWDLLCELAGDAD